MTGTEYNYYDTPLKGRGGKRKKRKNKKKRKKRKDKENGYSKKKFENNLKTFSKSNDGTQTEISVRSTTWPAWFCNISHPGIKRIVFS